MKAAFPVDQYLHLLQWPLGPAQLRVAEPTAAASISSHTQPQILSTNVILFNRKLLENETHTVQDITHNIYQILPHSVWTLLTG